MSTSVEKRCPKKKFTRSERHLFYRCQGAGRNFCNCLTDETMSGLSKENRTKLKSLIETVIENAEFLNRKQVEEKK